MATQKDMKIVEGDQTSKRSDRGKHVETIKAAWRG